MNADTLKNIETATPSAAAKPPSDAPTVPGVKSTLEAVTGNAGATAPATGGTQDADLLLSGVDNLADYLEGKLEEISSTNAPQNNFEKSAQQTIPETQTPKIIVNGDNDPLFGQGVEISVEIYVEILEAVTSSLAAWYSGDNETPFNFDAKLKARYRRVSELYMKTQNITVSPGFLFFAFTVVLIGQVGIKAYQRRGQIIKIESYRASVRRKIDEQAAPKITGQFSLFPEGEKSEEISMQNSGAKKDAAFVPFEDRNRKDWSIDQRGFYIKDQGHTRLPESQRTRKPSAAMEAFFLEFRNVHGRNPTNKEVKTYLKTV